MVYSIFYVVYGIPINSEFLTAILEFAITTDLGDIKTQELFLCAEKGCKEYNNLDPKADPDPEQMAEYLVEDFYLLEWFEKSFGVSVRTEYNGHGDGHPFFGEIVYTVDEIASGRFLPLEENVFRLNDDLKVATIQQSVRAFHDLLPEHLADQVPEVGYYWIMGTS